MAIYLNHLAVYGTLRKGQNRNFLEEAGCRYLGNCTIYGQLWDLGPYPGYVKQRTPSEKVVVSVYRLPKKKYKKIKLLCTLDTIENYIYNRETVICDGIESYIYTVRDWALERATQITTEYAADWVEWKKKG